MERQKLSDRLDRTVINNMPPGSYIIRDGKLVKNESQSAKSKAQSEKKEEKKKG